MRGVAWSVIALVGCSSPTPAKTPPGGSGSSGAAAATATAVRAAPAPAAGAIVAIGPPPFSLGTRPELVAFSHDGTKVAACGVDGRGRIWDAATGAPIATLPSTMYRCTALAWMPDDALIAVAGVVHFTSSRSAISVVDTAGHQRASSSIDGGDGVHSLLPIDARTIAVGVSDGYGMLSLDAPTLVEELRWNYDGRHGAIRGATAVVAHGDTIVVRRGDRELCSAPVDRMAIEALEVSADERQVTVMLRDGSQTFDAATCAVVGRGAPGQRAPDGRVVITTAFGFELRAPGAQPAPEHRDAVVTAAIANDATITTASDDAVIAWRDRGARGVALHASPTVAPEFDPGGTRVAVIVVQAGGAFVDVVELATGEVARHRVTHTPSRVSWLGPDLVALGLSLKPAIVIGPRRDVDTAAAWIAASPDGVRRLHLQEVGAMSTPHLVLYVGDDSLGELGEDAFGVERAVVGAARMVVASIDVEPETPRRYQLAAYEVPSRQPVELPAQLSEGGSAVALLHASDTIVAGTSDGMIVVWDGTTTRTRQTPAGRIVAIAVSPDDKLVATVHAGGEIYAWELAAIR